jgi:hypothetical protein
MFLLILTMGCTSGKKADRDMVAGPDNTPEATDAPGLSVNEAFASIRDSSTYIGLVSDFEGTGELYTDLYFQKTFEFGLYDELRKKSDSLVYQDEEIKRWRVPMPLVFQYFDMRGLQKIGLFDSTNTYVGSATFRRAELFEDFIEGRFIAVFKADGKITGTPVYGISHGDLKLEDSRYTPIKNDTLNAQVLAFLDINRERLWKVEHFSVNPPGKVHSLVSADTTSYLVEKTSGDLRYLYKSRYSEMIDDLVFVPVNINGRPAFLTRSSMPETDMTWSSLLVFNKTQYEVTDNGRVNLK